MKRSLPIILVCLAATGALGYGGYSYWLLTQENQKLTKMNQSLQRKIEKVRDISMRIDDLTQDFTRLTDVITSGRFRSEDSWRFDMVDLEGKVGVIRNDLKETIWLTD